MPFTAWQKGQQVLVDDGSHWFGFDLDRQNGEFLITVPYTTQDGKSGPPYDVTLTTIGIDANGNVIGPIPVASYATGFNFATADVGLADNEAAIFWTSANGTYPASSAVDLNVRTIDDHNVPVGAPVTLLTDIPDMYQFRVSSAATGGSSYVLAYSTFNAFSSAEEVHFAAFEPDGTPIAGESGLLDAFTTGGDYDAFGFGTLVPSTGADPSFIYLRAEETSTGPELAYRTVGTDGAIGPDTPIDLAYPADSTQHQLLGWSWNRLDPPTAGGNNLVTVSLLSGVSAMGVSEQTLDVHILDAGGGSKASNDDLIPIYFDGTSFTTTRLPNGGFVVGYTELNTTYLREYDNSGDIIGGSSATGLPSDATNLKLSTLDDGRILAVYETGGGSSLDYDVFTVPTSPIAYRVGDGQVRDGIVLKANDQLTVKAGGLARGVKNSNGYGSLIIERGGATEGTVLNRGFEEVLEGGTSRGTIVTADSQQTIAGGGAGGGTAVGAIIRGTQSTGGTTRKTVVQAGGYQFVWQNARDYGAILNTKGTQWSNGFEYGTVINGGDQLLYMGGKSSHVTVNSGDQDVSVEGSASATTVNGGTQYLDNGGSATNTTVNRGGTLSVGGGSTVATVTANAGGIVDVGGTVSNLSAHSATVDVASGAIHLTGASVAALPRLDGGTAQPTLDLGGAGLSVAGAAHFGPDSGSHPPLVTGTAGGTLVLGGMTTISSLLLGGSVLLRDTGTVTQSGTVTLGDSFNGAARIAIAPGARWELAGDTGIAAGSPTATLEVAGTLVKTAGSTARSVVGVTVTNTGAAAGTVEVAAGTLELGRGVSGKLAVKADAGTTLIFDKAVGPATTAGFAGSAATIQLNDAWEFHGTIAGFASGDRLDLPGLFNSAKSPASLTYEGNGAAGTLTVSDATHAVHLAIGGNYAAGSFHLGADGHGGSLITVG